MGSVNRACFGGRSKTLAAIALCLLMVLLPSMCFAETVSIGSGEYPPFTGETLPHGGFVNHVISEAFHAVGKDVVIQYSPWARTHELVRIGTLDAISYLYSTENRKRDYWLSAPVTTERLVVFSRKDTSLPDWQSLEDFKGYLIGATRGFTYTDEFWRLVDRGVLKVDPSNNDYFNFLKLLGRRIDLFFTGELVGFATLRQGFAPGYADTVCASRRSIGEHVGTIAFTKTKQGKQFCEEFNKGLKKLMQSGRYQEMHDALIRGGYNP